MFRDRVKVRDKDRRSEPNTVHVKIVLTPPLLQRSHAANLKVKGPDIYIPPLKTGKPVH